ncbi:MAG TPA: hypothetical protein VF598_14245 [Hymenobacter sp.]|jgi:hypothetical protein
MHKAFSWMERGMISVAIIGLALIITSTLGGAMILVVGLAFLSLLYFAAGYFQPTQKIGQHPSIAVSLAKIISGLTLSILVIGSLFKLMLWNSAAVMLIVGLVGAFLMAFVLSVLTRNYNNALGVIQRCIVWTCLGMVLYFTSSTALFELHHPNDPVLVEKFNAQEAHPNDPSYKADFELYRRQHHAQQSAQ